MERVLVTGATGFLGGAILRRLGARGLGQGRNPSRLARLASEGFNTVSWELPAPAPSLSDFEGVTTIVHCAAHSAPFGSRKLFKNSNVDGTLAVLDLALALGVKRFVHISSPSVYFRLADQTDVGEDAAFPKPFTAYAESKIAAENLVGRYLELGPVILRPRGIYGPGDTSLLPRLLAAAKKRPLPRFREGRARIDLTFVEDVVDAVMAAIEADEVPSGRAYNISGGEVLPVDQIVDSACLKAGVTARWRTMPLQPALLAARLAETLAHLAPGEREPTLTRYAVGLFAFEQSLNIQRAKNELNWSPRVQFAEGLDRSFPVVRPR